MFLQFVYMDQSRFDVGRSRADLFAEHGKQSKNRAKIRIERQIPITYNHMKRQLRFTSWKSFLSHCIVIITYDGPCYTGTGKTLLSGSYWIVASTLILSPHRVESSDGTFIL